MSAVGGQSRSLISSGSSAPGDRASTHSFAQPSHRCLSGSCRSFCRPTLLLQPLSCSTAGSRAPQQHSAVVCAGRQQPKQLFPRRPHLGALGGDTIVTTQELPSNRRVWTLPTVLTICRVVAIPALIAVWFSDLQHSAVICTAIFIVAAITDFLDGYLARMLKSVSTFGTFLDPVADKLMVAAVLVLLSTRPIAHGPWAGNVWLLPMLTSAIIGREITMSAVREWAAALGESARQAVTVSAGGKLKTATQMAALALLLLASGEASTDAMIWAATLGPPLLCVAAWLTYWSLFQYFRALAKYMF